ncbi:oligosaccharide flippase family protein [Halopseudomonas pachastrellae]|nr:oligosaccharide flippase family protein [Halopseudomonas pachastrellae]
MTSSERTESRMRHGQKLLYATAIRLLVIPVKFLFVFYLASAINLTSLGQYALVAALSSYCIYIVGLEVHSHVNRLGIGGSRRDWNELLSNQMGLYALTSTVFVATTLLAEHYNIISVPYVYFFIAITIAEHFGQESYRTLISLQDQLFASITLFIRSALWPIITIAYGMLGGKVSLDLIFSLWTACGVTGSIVGYIYIATTYAQGSKFRLKISKPWIANAIKVSSIFLLCTLTLRIAQTADRYIVSLFESAKTLGIYSFYVMIALSISSVLVFIGPGRIYPELIIAKKRVTGRRIAQAIKKC